MACGFHAREIEDSTITSVLNEYLLDFQHMGALRKEQKTCLVNLVRGKDVFVILPTDNKVAITERLQGVIYVLQSRFTLSLDLLTRTSWSLKIIA